MDKPNVLIIDDDQRFCMALSKALKRRGFSVEVVNDSEEAVHVLRKATRSSVAILDLKMPKLSGLDVLKRTMRREVPIIMLTGHGAVPEAVEAMKAGAYTFLNKPIDAEDLEPMILQAHQQTYLSSELIPFVGESSSAQQVRSMIMQFASNEELVLITGPTGSGKEVVARALHQASYSKQSPTTPNPAPFISVNMSILPTDRFEQLLFGDINDDLVSRASLVEQAMGGTLFLDEIDELSLEQQSKLLHFIDDKVYRPLGGEEKVFIGRIIVASCRQLAVEVKEGRFRQDLFYRLIVLPINLNELSRRGEDARLILEYWLKRVSKTPISFNLEALDVIKQYLWPGNAREVVNLARRLAVIAQMEGTALEDSVEVDLVWIENLLSNSPFEGEQSKSFETQQIELQSNNLLGSDMSMEAIEKIHIQTLIDRHENLSLVARILGVNRRTLQRKLKQWS